MQSTRQHLLDAVRDPLAAIETASALLREGPGDRSLKLAVVPTFASVWLVPRLRSFQELHPGVRLNFVPYRNDEDFSGQAPDAAILAGLGPSQWPHFQCDYVIGHEVVPVCHPRRLQQRRAQGRWQHPRDLAPESLLHHTTSFDQVSILKLAAIADMGVVLVQRCLVREEIADPQLAIAFDLPIQIQRG